MNRSHRKGTKPVWNLLKRTSIKDRGVLTFEWVLLISVLIIGIVGGYTALRDAVIDEMGDISDAALALDQSFTTTAPARYQSLGDWGHYEDPHAAKTPGGSAQKAERGRLFDAAHKTSP
jgi:hypothetical protein